MPTSCVKEKRHMSTACTDRLKMMYSKLAETLMSVALESFSLLIIEYWAESAWKRTKHYFELICWLFMMESQRIERNRVHQNQVILRRFWIGLPWYCLTVCSM